VRREAISTEGDEKRGWSAYRYVKRPWCQCQRSRFSENAHPMRRASGRCCQSTGRSFRYSSEKAMRRTSTCRKTERSLCDQLCSAPLAPQRRMTDCTRPLVSLGKRLELSLGREVRRERNSVRTSMSSERQVTYRAPEAPTCAGGKGGEWLE
jgi:hypothetical protein